MKQVYMLSFLMGFICNFAIFAGASPVTSDGRLICDYYNKDQCSGGNMAACNSTETCSIPEEGKRSHCYALWDNASVVRMKGCWLDHSPCYDKQECVVHDVVEGRMFCCCEGLRCNAKLVIPPTLPTMHPRGKSLYTTPAQPLQAPMADNLLTWTLMLTILPLLMLSLIILILFIICRTYNCQRLLYHHQSRLAHEPEQLMPAHEHRGEADELAVYVDEPPLCIEKLEVKAHGRFGSVWTARMLRNGGKVSAEVAVKVFPMVDRASWATEREFYSTVRGHPNILRYIGAQVDGVDLWLVTEYHKHGSLYDYLKSNSLTVPHLLRIALTMYRGLSYLHSVSPDYSRGKPAMAHRDVKSRNVLLKSDMTACIADFGLVLRLGPGMGNVHNQVGTRRYMSPEVLDGSINFNIENFLRIDIYASALILWELLSRCIVDEEKLPVPEYRMPFENEVGAKPKLEEMQDLVVAKKFRPHILAQWQQHEILGSLCSTMEECWDQDPEARLSAECVEARLSLMCCRISMPSTESSLCTSMSRLFPEKDSANTTLTTSTTSSAVS